MKRVHKLKSTYLDVIWRLRIWQNDHGQDLIEYALMAGFVAVAAGAISVERGHQGSVRSSGAGRQV